MAIQSTTEKEHTTGETSVQKENKMGTMPIPWLIFNMSMPIVISMLVQALYNIVDSVFVGMYQADALEAVSIAFPMQNLMIAVAVGTAVGVNALLSRHLGEKRQDAVNATANTGLFLSVCSYLVFVVIGLFAIRPFYTMQSSIPAVVTYGEQYLSVVMFAGIGIFVEIMCERILQATGRTVYTMITQGTGAIINIILDPILIFGLLGFPSMGVTGAAVATVIGQIFSALLALFFNIRINHEVTLSFRRMLHPEKREIGRIYEIGIPSILMASITSFLTVGMNLILKKFSEDAITVYGVYFKISSFVFMPVFGLNNGMVPILGYNFGARRYDRLRSAIRVGIIAAVSYMLVGLVVFELFPAQLLALFSATEGVTRIGVVALRRIALSFSLAGVSIVCGTVFQAVGNPVHSLIVTIVRQLVMILPVAFLLSLLGNVDLVWWSYPIAETVALLLSLLFLRHTLGKIGRLEQAEV